MTRRLILQTSALAAALAVLAAGLLVATIASCATTYRCDGDLTVRLRDRAVVVECPTGPAPTLTVTGSRVTGPKP